MPITGSAMDGFYRDLLPDVARMLRLMALLPPDDFDPRMAAAACDLTVPEAGWYSEEAELVREVLHECERLCFCEPRESAGDSGGNAPGTVRQRRCSAPTLDYEGRGGQHASGSESAGPGVPHPHMISKKADQP
ncbi:hypothetical protein ACIRQP_40485 [Streptomyces sp. NPDC102274]|uniref:hypothetical protein n=1 Tax=Streptomyces sp. NPDC102274 TaxID=3366151 RepID=UPI00381A26B8